MKVITLWQPWATLIPLGLKTIETRSFPAPKSLVGQTIAIHSAKMMPSYNKRYVKGISLWHESEHCGGGWWLNVWDEAARTLAVRGRHDPLWDANGQGGLGGYAVQGLSREWEPCR